MVIHDSQTIRAAREGLQRGLTYDQIANVLGTTKGVVAGIIHRRIRGLGPGQAGSRLRKLMVARETILASLLAGDSVTEAARQAKVTLKTVRRVRDQLVDEGRLIPKQAAVSVPSKPEPEPTPPPSAQPTPSVTVTSDKPSALLALRPIQPVSTPRPHVPKAMPTWDASTQRRLAAAVAASSSLQEVADRMGMTVLGVGTRMSRTGLKLTTVLTWTERDAVDRLHGEGVTPHRIAVRVGVPRSLVDERIGQIEDGTAIRIWIDGPESGTRAKAHVGKDGGSSPQDVGKGLEA